MRKRLAVLMTCHNRRKMTLRCMRELLAQLGKEDRVFLVDDGSTDGTGNAIESFNAEAQRRGEAARVSVLVGDGSLYWAKGMRKAWDAAGDDWEGYLWLNDDTDLANDAIFRLMSHVSCPHSSALPQVLVGDIVDERGKKIYGLGDDGLFNGNFVFVPCAVVRKVGRICDGYAHAWADSDYAMRCMRVGIEVESIGEVGKAEAHPLRPSLTGKRLVERWRLLFDPKGWNLHDLWLYRRRNWSIFHAVASVVHMAFHVLFSRAEHVERIECSTRPGRNQPRVLGEL